MCTLSYIPSETGFLFTTNRDERKLRTSALAPDVYTIHGKEVTFPKDGAAGGTWFATSEEMHLCLLNGAFTTHVRKESYRLSRGLVVLDVYAYPNFLEFYQKYPLSGIEPFTLIAISTQASIQMYEMRWDGQNKFLIELDSKQPAIWSSATLYTEEIRLKRESWFNRFIEQNPNPNQEDVLKFHQFSGEGDQAIDLVMRRGDHLQTLSICSLSYFPPKKELWYLDLVQNTRHSLHKPHHV